MAFINILVFPGLLFLAVLATLAEYLDRKVVARMQDRAGPPWYQPLADFCKLLGKRVVVPKNAKRGMFRPLPFISLAAAAAAYLSVPVWGEWAVSSYQGDLVVVLYLLTLPTICLFLAGWGSGGIYGIVGAFRNMTQMFAYEAPLFMAFLSPAIMAGTWSISGIMAFFDARPLWALVNLPAFFIALVAAQIKLSRAPFDAPEAETEVVGGALAEFGGRYLALFRLAAYCELVIVVSIIAALFCPFTTGVGAFDFILYLLEIFALLFILSVTRASMARLRLDQTMNLCWKLLTPAATTQLVLDLVLKGVVV